MFFLLIQTRDARYNVYPWNETNTDEDFQYRHNMLDDLMEEIPGKPLRESPTNIWGDGNVPYSWSINHSTLLFFAAGDLNFLFRDHFWLVVSCIVHSCARHSYTRSSTEYTMSKIAAVEWLTLELLSSMVMSHNK